MTVASGAMHVARCEACGALWLDANALTALETVGLDGAARRLAADALLRRDLRGPYREACARGTAVRGCPVCHAELELRYLIHADVTIRACEHGTFVERDHVVRFLLASVRRAVVKPVTSVAEPRHPFRSPRPGGLWLRLGAGAFVVSLMLPAMADLGTSDVRYGIACLAFGPFAVIVSPAFALPVMANVFALALLIGSRRMSAGVNGLFAVVFASGVAFASGFAVLGDAHTLVGYWVWVAALLFLAVGTGVRAVASRAML